jgi:hypothetical protein
MGTVTKYPYQMTSCLACWADEIRGAVSAIVRKRNRSLSFIIEKRSQKY